MDKIANIILNLLLFMLPFIIKTIRTRKELQQEKLYYAEIQKIINEVRGK